MSPDYALPASSLNVLMFGLSDYILTGTGGGDVRDRHIEYAKRLNHLHMVVYSPQSRSLQPERISDHLTVYPTRSSFRVSFPLDAYRIGARICRENDIHVTTTQDPFSTGLIGYWIKLRYKIPLDVQSHASFFDNKYWIQQRPVEYGLFNRLGKFIARQADTMRVVNTDERERSIRAGVDAHRIEVINTPVNLERFLAPVDIARAEALRSDLGIPLGAPVVFWAGRMVWFKQLPTLLEAFAIVLRKHYEARLVLVGDTATPEGQQAVAMAGRLGITDRVIFTGHIDHDKLSLYYALGDVYALTSVYEGLPKVLVEAAASGMPVVSTAMAGGKDAVLDGETGLLTRLEDAGDTADKIITLLDDPPRMEEMGTRAREHAAVFYDRTRTIERIVDMWVRCAAMRKG